MLTYHCSFLSYSLTSISSIPSRFFPEPSPPSPQYLSYSVCSTICLLPVDSSSSRNLGFCLNFRPSPFFMTCSFTCYQSALKGVVLSFPLLKAS